MSETMIPEWTLGWRMKRALAHANLTTDDMAAELGVSRSTISAWVNDHGAEPRIGYLKLWAIRTEVPLEWLVSGGLRTAPISARLVSVAASWSSPRKVHARSGLGLAA